jgi:hypothetical protein
MRLHILAIFGAGRHEMAIEFSRGERPDRCGVLKVRLCFQQRLEIIARHLDLHGNNPGFRRSKVHKGLCSASERRNDAGSQTPALFRAARPSVLPPVLPVPLKPRISWAARDTPRKS